MKIDFTKEQYQILMNLVYMGNWVVNSYETDCDDDYDQLEKYVFSKAGEFSLEELADEEGLPTRKFEEESEVFDFIDDYDEQSFWDELTQRLAYRDACKKYGEKTIMAMEPEERFPIIEELLEKYEEIFEKNGLEAVTLIAPLVREK